MGCVGDICEALSQYMVVTDVYNHRFHKVFVMSEAISQIMDRDDIFIYEVPVSSHEDQERVVLPIYMREESGEQIEPREDLVSMEWESQSGGLAITLLEQMKCFKSRVACSTAKLCRKCIPSA